MFNDKISDVEFYGNLLGADLHSGHPLGYSYSCWLSRRYFAKRILRKAERKSGLKTV